jgi:two-component system, NarL family, nitrate/nitrite response regulator NarL
MAESRLEAPIRVLLACDLPVVAWGLARLVESGSPGMRCTGVAGTPADALVRLRDEPADVILLDMDGDNGIGTIPQLLGNKARVLVLTNGRDLDLHDAAILAGASGAMSKRDAAEVLPKAIAKVHAGEFWVDRSATVRILMAVARQKAAANPEREKFERLTRKERLTVSEIVRDASAPGRGIAARLHISEHTLRNHLSSIYAKLEVHSRMELYAYASRHGLS